MVVIIYLNWEKEFDDKFKGIYYGKDENGEPNYPPLGFVEDVKQFIESLDF